MADPILPDFYKAQFILKGLSGLPEDVYVNNWFFRNDESGALATSITGRIQTVLTAFYTGAAANARTISSFLSPVVGDVAELRVYDLGQPVPRVPEIRDVALAPRAADGLPSEVACCLSFYADRNLPRQRGRLYLGPLSKAIAVQEVGRMKVHSDFLTTVLDRAKDVRDTTQNVSWAQVSQVGLAAKLVTHVWVDDAFDTQRRRGEDPVSRMQDPAA